MLVECGPGAAGRVGDKAFDFELIGAHFELTILVLLVSNVSAA